MTVVVPVDVTVFVTARAARRVHHTPVAAMSAAVATVKMPRPKTPTAFAKIAKYLKMKGKVSADSVLCCRVPVGFHTMPFRRCARRRSS